MWCFENLESESKFWLRQKWKIQKKFWEIFKAERHFICSPARLNCHSGQSEIWKKNESVAAEQALMVCLQGLAFLISPSLFHTSWQVFSCEMWAGIDQDGAGGLGGIRHRHSRSFNAASRVTQAGDKWESALCLSAAKSGWEARRALFNNRSKQRGGRITPARDEINPQLVGSRLKQGL